MRPRRGVLHAASVVLALLAAACGSPEEPLPPSISNPVTIRIAAFAGPETSALFRIIPEWEHQTGNRVQLGVVHPQTGDRYIPDSYVEYRDAIIGNAADLAGLYDVIIIDDPWMPFLAGNQRLRPLSPFGYETDPDFIDRSSALGVWPPPFGPLPPDASYGPRGQNTYALPLVGNAMVLWYRGDIIEKPDTLDALTLSLAAPDPAFTGRAGLVPSKSPQVIMTWLSARGAEVFDREWRATPLRSQLAVDAFAEYLREVSRLDVPFADYEGERFASHTRMLDGTASAAIAWAADAQRLLDSSVSDQLRVTAVPAGRRMSALTGNWLLGLPSDGRHAAVAFDFIVWATSPQIMKTSALIGVPPARKSLFADRELISRYPWLPDVEIALSTAFARPRIPAWDVVEQALSCAFDSALRSVEGLQPDDPEDREAYTVISRTALEQGARDIEDLMRSWGYYDDGRWINDPSRRVVGDPTLEYDCMTRTIRG